MNCPICGKEMIEGRVRAGGSVFFFDEEYADLHWKPGEHSALLTRANVASPTADAWCCRACKKVVVDYADIPQSKLKSLFLI